MTQQPTINELNQLSIAEETQLLNACPNTDSGDGSLRVLSWNILAQCLIKRDQFPYVSVAPNSPNPLSQKTRAPRICSVLGSLGFDAAALQEVDVDQWTAILNPSLVAAGFDVEHFRKNPEKKGGHGLAFVWRKDCFTRVDSKVIHFDEHPLIHPTDFNPVTGNIGAVIALKYTGPNPKLANFGIVLSNHHLFWWPKAKFEKLRQIYVLLNDVKDFTQQLESLEPGVSKWPHVMCGDFNTTPADALYHVLTAERPLSQEIIDCLTPVVMTRPTKAGVNELSPSPSPTPPVVPSTSDAPIKVLSKEFLVTQVTSFGKYISAYRNYRDIDVTHPDISTMIKRWSGEPSFTSFDEWRGTLDYIMTRENEDRWGLD
ncbi:hypothetical protein HDU99_006309, partial [Rhizoclosmatium hyalinum]